MGSDGFISIYSLPDLKLIGKEDCVDASDAFGQRNFALTSHGLLLNMKSPSEFIRGSLAEQARMTVHFSIPSHYTEKVTTPEKSGPILNGSMVSFTDYQHVLLA